MNTKTKTAISAGVTAVGVATAALFGLNTTDEAVIQNETTPIVETYEENSEEETEVIAETAGETEATDNGRIISAPTETDDEQVENVGNTDTLEDDPLAPYRTAVEKDGVLIYYYENVPLDLMPLLINKNSGINTYSLTTEAVSVDDSDLSIVDKYIFIQSANGILYLSQLSHGIVSDERISQSDFSGYMIYLNKSIECYDWLPFKDFAGSLYGNGNSLYVMTVAVDITLTIDNMFADNFRGRLEGLTIYCNSELTTLINNSNGAYFNDVEFCGSVTYLIENAENTVFDDCGIFAKCDAVINNAVSVTVKNTIIENEMKIALLATASGNCVIENNIIASIIQGEPESKCGAYAGTLKNEIILKNNLSQCVIDVPVGYGGHAIGYADYEYKDCENMSGNYFESDLTVEGEKSLRYIGNIDFKHINTTLEAIDNFDMSTAAVGYTVGNVATTVYNLGLFPYGLILDGETEEIKRLRAEQEKQAEYNGYYEIIDIAAMNQTAKQNGNTQIVTDGENYYFEEPEVPDELTITDVTYTEGNVIIFFNQVVTDKTAIVTTMADNKLLTMSITNITAETVFVEMPHAENAETVKVMVWESMESMKPICEAYEKEIAQ